MRLLLRALMLAPALAILIPATHLPAQTSDPFVGTWKLNTAKSTYRPGPAPKSITVMFMPAGKGLELHATGVDGEGKPVDVHYLADGYEKDVPAMGSPDYDTVWLKRVNPTTLETTRKKGGKTVQTLRSIVAKDGKSYTSTTTGTNAKGQQIHTVATYEKQ